MSDVSNRYYSATRFMDQLAVTGRVLTAMMLRETKTRFGRSKFGYVWALIEPAAYVCIFVVVRNVSQEHIPFGQDLALFVVSGMLTFRMFSAIATRGLSAITANKALLAYPPVKPLDVIAARVVLETLTMYVIWVIFLCILSLAAEHKVIVNYARFAEAMAGLTFLSIAVGTFNGALSVILPSWERVWSIVRLPLLLLSGIFYVPVQMPPLIQSVIAWNPVLHCVEWIRTGTYMTYEPMLSIPYVLTFGGVALCLGLILERAYRYKSFS